MRKTYVSPAVVSEDLLEQTSLACNATTAFVPTNNGGNFGSGVVGCTIDVGKNGAFANDNLCETILEGPGEIVALS